MVNIKDIVIQYGCTNMFAHALFRVLVMRWASCRLIQLHSQIHTYIYNVYVAKKLQL